jgi:DNA polymerase I-like protein with 3'-5' exonuclease and polymerase domains
MASRKAKSELFADLLGSRPTQLTLLGDDGPPLGEGFFPPIYRDYAGFSRTLREAQEEGALGYDLEFTGLRPTIVGIASKRSAASLPHEQKLVEEIWDSGLPLVGHAVISADKPVTEAVLGFKTDLHRWEDTLLYFYILHQHYAKTEDRSESGESTGESGSIGLFDLFSCSAHYLLIPNYKECRGKFCTGPCPKCDVWGYNAVDSWAPLMAWYEMKRQYEKQFPSKLAYWHKAEMAEIAEKMQDRGVQYDMERAAEISNEIAAKREETAASLPFNPGSSKQIIAYFEAKGISLESASKDIVLHTLRSTAEEYGYSLDEIDSTSPELLQHLKSLYEWKQAGKGLKSWTDPKYLDRQNRVHPRTIVASTTTGRLSSTSPNMMNVVKRGSMARMREIVVPSRPDYCLVDSDASQLELRIVLFEAGYSEALEGDAYSMTVSAVGNLFDGPAKDTNRKPRDIAKIVVLGTNYMLGYHAYRPGDLRTGFNRQLLDQGAIHIFPDWMYCGMHMCMNGKKLAFLLFGDDTIEHRRKAIEIQLGYLERFPRVLSWQERIAKEVETTNRIARANGYFLNLYKDPNDNLKKATAFIGQGYGADYCQGAIRAFYQKYGAVPLLTVHDELCFEVPKSWADEECKQFMSLMSEENDMYPGFRCPIETKRGDSWGTLKLI